MVGVVLSKAKQRYCYHPRFHSFSTTSYMKMFHSSLLPDIYIILLNNHLLLRNDSSVIFNTFSRYPVHLNSATYATLSLTNSLAHFSVHFHFLAHRFTSSDTTALNGITPCSSAVNIQLIFVSFVNRIALCLQWFIK